MNMKTKLTHISQLILLSVVLNYSSNTLFIFILEKFGFGVKLGKEAPSFSLFHENNPSSAFLLASKISCVPQDTS